MFNISSYDNQHCYKPVDELKDPVGDSSGDGIDKTDTKEIKLIESFKIQTHILVLMIQDFSVQMLLLV